MKGHLKVQRLFYSVGMVCTVISAVLCTVFINRISTNITSNLGTKDLQWVWKEIVQGCEVRDRITEKVNFSNA